MTPDEAIQRYEELKSGWAYEARERHYCQTYPILVEEIRRLRAKNGWHRGKCDVCEVHVVTPREPFQLCQPCLFAAATRPKESSRCQCHQGCKREPRSDLGGVCHVCWSQCPKGEPEGPSPRPEEEKNDHD